MATVNYTLDTGTSAHAVTVVWESLSSTNSNGQAFQPKQRRDMSVQTVGAAYGGGNLLLQGSNDGVTWATLTDPTGSNLAFSANGLKAVTEFTRYVRPLLSGATGGDVDVYLTLGGAE